MHQHIWTAGEQRILRSGFVKSLQHEQTFSDYGVAALQAAGYPDSFIKFLGGSDHD